MIWLIDPSGTPCRLRAIPPERHATLIDPEARTRTIPFETRTRSVTCPN